MPCAATGPVIVRLPIKSGSEPKLLAVRRIVGVEHLPAEDDQFGSLAVLPQ